MNLQELLELFMVEPTKSYGKEGRVGRFVDLCMEQYKCYEEGYITLEELAKCLKDEAGVEIEGGD